MFYLCTYGNNAAYHVVSFILRPPSPAPGVQRYWSVAEKTAAKMHNTTKSSAVADGQRDALVSRSLVK